MMEVVLLFCRPGHCLKKHGEDINPCDDEARPPSPPSCGILWGFHFVDQGNGGADVKALGLAGKDAWCSLVGTCND